MTDQSSGASAESSHAIDALIDGLVNFEMTDGVFLHQLSQFGADARLALPRLLGLVETCPQFNWLWGCAIAMIEPEHPTARRLLDNPIPFIREKVIEGLSRASQPPADMDDILRKSWDDDDHWVRASAARLSLSRGDSAIEIANSLLRNSSRSPVYSGRDDDFTLYSSAGIKHLQSAWGADLKLLIELVESSPDTENEIRGKIEDASESELNINVCRLMWKLGVHSQRVSEFLSDLMENGGLSYSPTAACELVYLMGPDAGRCAPVLMRHLVGEGRLGEDLLSKADTITALGAIGVREPTLLQALTRIVLQEPAVDDNDTELRELAAEALGTLVPQLTGLTATLKRVINHWNVLHGLEMVLDRESVDSTLEQALARFIEDYE